jgi:hypothetical protein
MGRLEAAAARPNSGFKRCIANTASASPDAQILGVMVKKWACSEESIGRNKAVVNANAARCGSFVLTRYVQR